jgi:hypothetical protein
MEVRMTPLEIGRNYTLTNAIVLLLRQQPDDENLTCAQIASKLGCESAQPVNAATAWLNEKKLITRKISSETGRWVWNMTEAQFNALLTRRAWKRIPKRGEYSKDVTTREKKSYYVKIGRPKKVKEVKCKCRPCKLHPQGAACAQPDAAPVAQGWPHNVASAPVKVREPDPYADDYTKFMRPTFGIDQQSAQQKLAFLRLIQNGMSMYAPSPVLAGMIEDYKRLV